jgi:predicted Zn-dependent protease
MKTFKKINLILLLIIVSFLSGCSEVEITGRKRLNIMPDSMMNSMSFQNYGEFLAQNKLSTNARQVQMVKRVGARIQTAVEQYCNDNGLQNKLRSYEWEFNLIEDPNVNAWCMPGGKVVVYTGLLPVSQTEAGLAVVMGHEIAHAFAKHGAERMTNNLFAQTGSYALSKALEDKPEQTQNLFLSAYGVGAQVGFLLPYSRTHENEADHLGLVFMAMAGYDPQEAVTFWERMAAAKGGSQPLEFLSTHPTDATRIRKIRGLLPEAMAYYKPK